MHLEQVTTAASRKRKRQDDAGPATGPLIPTTKHTRTPSSFFDTLSRQWLTRRTLREFDRRTQLEQAPKRPGSCSTSASPSSALKRFARHGGPDLDNLRAYPEPTTASRMPVKKQQGRKRRSSSSGGKSIKKTASDTGKSSAYDAAFQGKMIDNGFYPYGHNFDSDDEPVHPANWDEIVGKLAEPRPSLSPSRFTQKDFRQFQRRNMEAASEADVMTNVFPTIAGQSTYEGKQGIPFNNLVELAPDIQKEVKVDFYDGSAPTALRKQVQNQLGQFIMPSTTMTLPIVPNFFTEAKGPNGSAMVVKNQALHAGTIGARGVQELRTFADFDDSLDGNAYTITSSFSGGDGGGVMRLYTVHPTASSVPPRQYDYHMTQINAFAMDSSPKTFREGASFFRNARDWAKTQRDELISAANVKHDEPLSSSTNTTARTGLSQPIATAHFDSDTSVDELSADVVDGELRTKTS